MKSTHSADETAARPRPRSVFTGGTRTTIPSSPIAEPRASGAERRGPPATTGARPRYHAQGPPPQPAPRPTPPGGRRQQRPRRLRRGNDRARRPSRPPQTVARAARRPARLEQPPDRAYTPSGTQRSRQDRPTDQWHSWGGARDVRASARESPPVRPAAPEHPSAPPPPPGGPNTACIRADARAPGKSSRSRSW